jgi:hypothetical protein
VLEGCSLAVFSKRSILVMAFSRLLGGVEWRSYICNSIMIMNASTEREAYTMWREIKDDTIRSIIKLFLRSCILKLCLRLRIINIQPSLDQCLLNNSGLRIKIIRRENPKSRNPK